MPDEHTGANGNVCGVRVQSAIPASIRRENPSSETMAKGTWCIAAKLEVAHRVIPCKGLPFGKFDKTIFRSLDDFLGRLVPFLKRLPQGHKFAVESRNKDWLVPKLADVLREPVWRSAGVLR